MLPFARTKIWSRASPGISEEESDSGIFNQGI
jgi:hypothetical protein